MDLPKSGDATSRFLAFVEGLTSVIGHADRAKPLQHYRNHPYTGASISRACRGLLWSRQRRARLINCEYQRRKNCRSFQVSRCRSPRRCQQCH